MRHTFLLTLALCSAAAAMADVPSTYYARLNGKTGAELKQAAYEIIYPHTKVSSYSNLPSYFQTTDVYPESMKWWDMYSNVVRYAPSFSGLNREHSMPKSWWKVGGDVEYTPAYVDLNHLYPADGPANQAKSNYPLGTVNMSATVTFNNNVSTIGAPVSGQGGGAKYVYEPADEYKGDFARTYFYMVTCYQNLQWNSSYLWMLQRNTYPTLTSWAVDLLLAWHRQDPVSQKEIDRNEAVWGFQNNRNPFIDFPDLAEYIWGRHVGEPFQTEGGAIGGDPELTAPVNGTTLDFGQVAVGSTAKALLFFKGTGLTSPLSISLGGADRAMFSIPENTISKELVNAPGGYYLQVSYTPTATGQHNARILIYDGGLPGTGMYVYFKGEALDVPRLSTLTAHEAADVKGDSYLASWTKAPETVDFYVVTRTRYLTDGNTVTEELETEETELLITEFDASSQETYSVQSSRLGYRSDPSNVIFVNHSGLSELPVGAPLTAESFPGLIRIGCSSTHTDVRIIDMGGHTVMTIPVLEAPGTDITLPSGVYLMMSAEHRTPVKLIAR